MDKVKSLVKHSFATKKGLATVAITSVGAAAILHYNKCKCVMVKNDKSEDVVSVPKLVLYSFLIGLIVSLLIRVAKVTYRRSMSMRRRRSPSRRRKYGCCM